MTGNTEYNPSMEDNNIEYIGTELEAEKKKAILALRTIKAEIEKIQMEDELLLLNIGMLKPSTERKFNYVVELQVKGKNKMQIVDIISKKYNITKADATKIYYNAIQWSKAIVNEEKENIKDKFYQQMSYLYAKAMENDDTPEGRREARETIKDMAKILGITEQQQNNFQVYGNNIEFKFNMPTEKKAEEEKPKLPPIQDTPFEELPDDDNES